MVTLRINYRFGGYGAPSRLATDQPLVSSRMNLPPATSGAYFFERQFWGLCALRSANDRQH